MRGTEGTLKYEVNAYGRIMQEIEKVEGIKGVSAKDVNFINGKPFEIPTNTCCKIVLDMGRLTNAYVDFSVDGGANSNMKVSYCESFTSPKLGGNKFGKGNRNDIEGKIPAYKPGSRSLK